MARILVHAILLAAPALGFVPQTSFKPRVAARAPTRVAPLTSTAATLERPKLAPEDEWIGKLDLEGFRKDIRALGKRLEAQQGDDDVKHIKKICLVANTCAFAGLASMWLAPNPLTVMALSLWTFSRWTTIAHHTCHGGYNNADKNRFFNSKGFALGSLQKRAAQWFDWMLPEVRTASVLAVSITTYHLL
jgi:hypothetical protein